MTSASCCDSLKSAATRRLWPSSRSTTRTSVFRRSRFTRLPSYCRIRLERDARTCRRLIGMMLGAPKGRAMRRDLTMQLRTRIEGGGTRPLDAWGVDSEYGTLRHVLIGPIDHFTWQPGNAVCQRAERVGLKYDFSVARRQYGEMVDVYRQAEDKVHHLAADPALPYQIFA